MAVEAGDVQQITLQAVPSQTLTESLSNQACQLNIYQRASGLYMDVLVNNSPIINGVICQNINRIVRDLYLGFQGDFVFVDTQGDSDPYYTGLGDRYQLNYLEPSDLPPGVG